MNLEKRKRRIKRWDKIGKILPILPFWFMQGVLFYVFWTPIWQTYQAQNWIAIEAIVEHVEICSYYRGDTDDKFEMIYSYHIQGESYLGKKLSFHRDYGSGDRTSEKLDKHLYPAEKILVYVNPQNFKEAVASKSFTNRTIVSFMFWFILTGILMIFTSPIPYQRTSTRIKIGILGLLIFFGGIFMAILINNKLYYMNNIPNEIIVTRFYE